jgi:shikimate kinase
VPVPSETEKAQRENKARPIVLIGFMATGKSTVGRIVARRLGRPFLDLDRVVEQVAGMPVADIFRSEGEPAFRRREAEALDQVLGTEGAVIATGGGAACREENLQLMLARGFVVALSAPPSEVVARTGAASGRPLLDGAADPLAVAQALLQQREPFYSRAHVRIETVGRGPHQVADEVIAALREHGGA